MLFDTVVNPIFYVGDEIYDTKYSGILEQVHIQYCKDFLGVDPSVNECVAFAECDKHPLCIRHHIKCIK
jgi:hypothetical protein